VSKTCSVLSDNEKKIIDIQEMKHVEVFKVLFYVSSDMSGGRGLNAHLPSFLDLYKDLHHPYCPYIKLSGITECNMA
jgi:hypothetical protein